MMTPITILDNEYVTVWYHPDKKSSTINFINLCTGRNFAMR